MLLKGYFHNMTTNVMAQLWSLKTTLQVPTLLLYLKAAALWLHTELNVMVHISCPTLHKILLLLCDPITQALKWGPPQPKWEPYMYQMLKTFFHHAC